MTRNLKEVEGTWTMKEADEIIRMFDNLNRLKNFPENVMRILSYLDNPVLTERPHILDMDEFPNNLQTIFILYFQRTSPVRSITSGVLYREWVIIPYVEMSAHSKQGGS